MRQHFRRYFTINDTIAAVPADSQAFTFRIQLRDPAAISGVFLPSLSRLDAGIVEGSFHNATEELRINADFNSLAYNDVKIDSLLFTTPALYYYARLTMEA